MTGWQPIETPAVRKIRGQKVYSPQNRIYRQSMPEPNSGCWLWLSAVRHNGNGIWYGTIVVGSRTNGTRRTVRAHRYAYEAFKGRIPDGLNVCHTCDNGLCVNPDHLWAGTQSENMKDAVRKGRVKQPVRWPKSEPPQ